MTTVKKSVTFSEFVYDTYLLNFGDNFSAYIEKLIILGHEALVNGAVEEKKKITSLIAQIEDLKRDIKKLKFDLNKAKNKKTFSFDEVVERYGLAKEDLDLFRERKERMDKYNKSNDVILNGQPKIELGAVSHQAANAINAEKGISMKPEEARVILENIEQQKLDEVD